MRKIINFGFYTIKAIHKKENRQEKGLTLFFKEIEQRPLNIEEQNHRYIYLSNENIITIANFEYVNNGIFLKLRKCKNKGAKGSFLGDGNQEYDVNQVLNSNFHRDDSITIEESFIKIFNNGVMVFQLNKNSITPNQFKYYLEEYLKEYRFEILPIYRDDLFEQLEKGSIKEVLLKVGFGPKGSKFNLESYSGATRIDVVFKKSHSKNFLSWQYFKELLTNRKTSQLGSLDNGSIEGANIILSNNSSPIKLEHYELREKQEFKSNEIANSQISNHNFFDSLLQKHNIFLKEYLARDARYD